MTEIKRLFIDTGHGTNNTGSGYDPGARSLYGQEHEIVTRIAGALVYAMSPLAVEEVPDDIPLRDTPAWINARYERGDYLISLHMNAGPSSASGTEVIYAVTAPVGRRLEAAAVSEAIAKVLRVPDRGAKRDIDTPSGKGQGLAIVRDTRCPALLIELGFVTNRHDVNAVRNRGVSAVANGIRSLIRP